MYLVIPGRHHLLTQFQIDYLQNIVTSSSNSITNVFGQSVPVTEPITAIIFAVTSANHSNTRRNPLPFYIRAIAIEAAAKQLSVPVYIYGIDDVGTLKNFADYTLKRLKHESDGLFNCTPQNTFIVCSTPVLHMYHALGYQVLPAELADINTWQYHAQMPWDLVEAIATNPFWQNDIALVGSMHPASLAIWLKYQLDKKARLLFADSMISSDGDLTETRDYNVYVRQMDDIAELKYKDTASYIQPGRIGDIGCAVGSWIKLASEDEALRESDLYGIEVSRHLFEICKQRKDNGDYSNPYVFFSKKNAVTGLVFDAASMNTIHTSSLTHEIESYGSHADLLQFIQNRYDELVPDGVWINRDVIGPENKHQQVYMWLNSSDGNNHNIQQQFTDRHQLSQHLQQLSTMARFLRFAKDFRAKEGYQVPYTIHTINNEPYVQLSLQDASEFLSRKDYFDNWESEMHETFCFWDVNEWQSHMQQVGFTIHPSSSTFTNQWIVDNRWQGKAVLYTLVDGNLILIPYPPTTMLLIAVKK
jgi:hypothetical protein